jgi:hypothetical protein
MRQKIWLGLLVTVGAAGFLFGECNCLNNKYPPRSPEAVNECLKCGHEKISDLYELFSTFDSCEYGKIIFEMHVSAAGPVSKVNIIETTLKDKEFQDSLYSEVSRWRFKKGSSSKDTAVFKLPFNFPKNENCKK